MSVTPSTDVCSPSPCKAEGWGGGQLVKRPPPVSLTLADLPLAGGGKKEEQHEVPRLLRSLLLALVIMNAFSLAVSWFSGQWILDSKGHGIPTDFVNVYAAGQLANEGQAALAYDWDAHKAIQQKTLGEKFDGYFGWHYPPPFLLIAMLLAKLPYAAAFAGWVALSFVPFALVMRGIVGHRLGWALAFAFPVSLSNAMIGQNGFLTASLIGGTLLLLPVRPVLAGVCLGLLSYKPQYGLLFPLVLIATAQWRAFASAAVTTLALAAASWLAFGLDTWMAFLHWLPRASTAFLSDGFAEFGKMQSLLSLTRFLGGGDGLARTLQWTLTAVVAVGAIALWRSRVRYELKAAALATAALLATPYLYLYDMVVLAIAVAFLIKLGMAQGFDEYELPALAAVFALLVSFPYVVAPVGFAATLIVAALILRRAGQWWRAPLHNAYAMR